jgi:multidrug efflux pump
MAHNKSDAEMIRTTHNTARYFTETRAVAWVLLILLVAWGVHAYKSMPKRKDPEIPVRVAAAIGSWPGASSDRVEDLLTRPMEEKIAENTHVERIDSTTRSSTAVVTVQLLSDTKDTSKEFDDIRLKLDTLRNLPEGASITFIKDFGETTALMLTVASPHASAMEVQLRADAVKEQILAMRHADEGGSRVTLVACFPMSLQPESLVETARGVIGDLPPGASDPRMFRGPGFIGVDLHWTGTEQELLEAIVVRVGQRLHESELHPDVWRLAAIKDPQDTESRLQQVAGERYTYKELESFTDTLQRRFRGLSRVSKVDRSGVLPETIFLEYSQERLAAYGIKPVQLSQLLASRNVNAPGGIVEVGRKTLLVNPSGEFKNEQEIGSIVLATSPSGAPVYLRDVVTITRGYQTPAQFLNRFTWKDAAGQWQTTRAITLAVSMRSGTQVAEFGEEVDAALAETRALLPDDLIFARTSDQPKQVEENVDLFMMSLWEAVILVVLVALVGFWEWRSALLMALSIPITLFMTFGMMRLLGLDIQQVSIASLIIALGLLVDDPVVAGDAIKRDLALGHPPIVSSWLGPTKLASAIMFATLTNIVSYLPFLTLPDDTGKFVFTLPVVLTCSLVASRIVSMSFIPMLGYYLLRPSKKAEPTLAERRERGFGRQYARLVGWTLDHRKTTLAIAAVLLVLGATQVKTLKQAYFPKDLSYLSYVDVWLPEDVPLSATRETAAQVDAVIRRVAEEYGREHPGKGGKPKDVLESVTSFIGGGGPRFWFSVSPEQQQRNYAQVLINVKDKHDTNHLIERLQDVLQHEIPGAIVDARLLENGAAVGMPVAVRISGEDIATLRALAAPLQEALRKVQGAERVRENWGADTVTVALEVDPDRASLAGVTNLDVARSSAAALSGNRVGELREGDLRIPIVSRLKGSERAQPSDLLNLYVASSSSDARVPLRQVASLEVRSVTEKRVRRNQVRTLTVQAYPRYGVLPSEVMAGLRPHLAKVRASLPPGYHLEVGGEEEEQLKGFNSLQLVLLICVVSIFLALVVQFKSATKPLIVFSAIPFGIMAALVSLKIMGAPFGFMAFLGCISLIGVIVSHVIVLFDFIEERHHEGDSLRDALIDAGILRLRPVLITVAATVFGLIPLAMHGGPLWEPLCYVQIGGLSVATAITLVLVPVLYTVFVKDLKLVKWDEAQPQSPGAPPDDGSVSPFPAGVMARAS